MRRGKSKNSSNLDTLLRFALLASVSHFTKIQGNNFLVTFPSRAKVSYMFATWNRLFKQKQERMNKFTKSGQGKLSGLPTGKLDPLNKHHLSISRQNNGSTTMRLCCSHQIRQAGWFGRPKRQGCQAQAHLNRGYAEERSNVYRLHDAQAAEDYSRQSCYWKTARRFALQCII